MSGRGNFRNCSCSQSRDIKWKLKNFFIYACSLQIRMSFSWDRTDRLKPNFKSIIPEFARINYNFQNHEPSKVFKVDRSPQTQCCLDQSTNYTREKLNKSKFHYENKQKLIEFIRKLRIRPTQISTKLGKIKALDFLPRQCLLIDWAQDATRLYEPFI